MSRIAGSHHAEAAKSCEAAAEHHKMAADAYEGGDHMKGAHHAEAAHGHRVEAKEHADEAAKYHAEFHGNDNDEDDQK